MAVEWQPRDPPQRTDVFLLLPSRLSRQGHTRGGELSGYCRYDDRDVGSHDVCDDNSHSAISSGRATSEASSSSSGSGGGGILLRKKKRSGRRNRIACRQRSSAYGGG